MLCDKVVRAKSPRKIPKPIGGETIGEPSTSSGHSFGVYCLDRFATKKTVRVCIVV